MWFAFCSKKNLKQRRQELLEGISSVLLQMVEKSASELLFDKGAIQLVGAALAKCTGRWCKYSDSLGSLSSDVFERRTSTGSEVFSLLTCLDDIKFVFLSFFTAIVAIWLKICAKPPSKNEKRPLPVDVRRSKTLLLKLPIKPDLHSRVILTCVRT